MPRDHIGGSGCPRTRTDDGVRLGHSGAWRAAVVPGLLLSWSSAHFGPIRARTLPLKASWPVADPVCQPANASIRS